MTDQHLVVALPSKGRLQEQALALFADAGMAVEQAHGARGYRGTLAGLPGVEVQLLPSADIAQRLLRGEVHLGVTGLDLLSEASADHERAVAALTALGFGHADVVVAVPDGWLDVRSMADLEEVAAEFFGVHGRRMRVATKFVALTRRSFAAHGIMDYVIVDSPGATEGAPGAGLAELIVDITTTGATLAANRLRVLDDGVILHSEAHLLAARHGAWTDEARRLANRLLRRLDAHGAAKARRLIRARVPVEARPAVLASLTTDGHRVEASGPEVSFHVPRGEIAAVADRLLDLGATEVQATDMDALYASDGPLAKRLAEALAT